MTTPLQRALQRPFHPLTLLCAALAILIFFGVLIFASSESKWLILLSITLALLLGLALDFHHSYQWQAKHVPQPENTVLVRDNAYYCDSGLYIPQPTDRLIPIRPDIEIIQVEREKDRSEQLIPIRWEPDRSNLRAWLNYFDQPPKDTRASFVEELTKLAIAHKDFGKEFLQVKYAPHYGVTFLAVEIPPAPSPPEKVLQPQKLTKFEEIVIRLRTVPRERKALLAIFAEEEKTDPEFWSSELGTKLRNEVTNYIYSLVEPKNL